MGPAQKTVQEETRAQEPDLLGKQLPNGGQEIEMGPCVQKRAQRANRSGTGNGKIWTSLCGRPG